MQKNSPVSIQNTKRLFQTFATPNEKTRPSIISRYLPSTPIRKSPIRHAEKSSSSQKRGKYESSIKKPLTKEENDIVEEEMTDFKKYLHKNRLLSKSPAIPQPTPVRSKSISDSQHMAMKERLDKKIKEAQQKMADLKASLKNRQAEKEEIVRNSNFRLSTVNTSRISQ